MYIIINKITNESAVIKEKIKLSDYINKSISTITRKKQLLTWQTAQFIIYNPQIILIKSSRGGKRK